MEIETACKWAERSLACFEEYLRTKNTAWLRRAESYRHEALEHAALAEDHGKTVAHIQTYIDGKNKKGRYVP